MTKKGNVLGVCAVTAAMAASLAFGPSLLTNQAKGLTGADIAYNTQYENTLKSIENNYNITFTNYDLYTSVAKQLGTNFNIEQLRDIESLKIDINTFENKDLSDLKYFTNLKKIELCNGVVDCSDLMYNQKLNQVIFSYCDVSNTCNLPNTITSLRINNCRVIDSTVSVPYDTEQLYLNSTVSNKIYVKNPGKLSVFSFAGYGFLDIADLKDCTNLKYLYLSQCPNVLHSEYLKNIEEDCKINLDEFCCVWANPDTISDIPSNYKKLMRELDQIANSLTNSQMTDEEKVEHLTMYVTAQIEYDHDCLGDDEASKSQLTDYNSRPITYALDGNRGVCVGYATLFKALANRVGLNSYQPDSINHTWNMVKLESDSEYRAYDLTQLDNHYVATGTFTSTTVDGEHTVRDYILDNREDELLFYGFNYQEANAANYSYNTNVEYIEVTNYNDQIGYINPNSSSNQKEKAQIRAKIFLGEAGIVLLLSYLKNIIKPKRKTRRRNQVKRRTPYQYR